ncbi:hypothetical protein HY251_03580 [bacterium]|nr:hypothetical protein [bacterium]
MDGRARTPVPTDPYTGSGSSHDHTASLGERSRDRAASAREGDHGAGGPRGALRPGERRRSQGQGLPRSHGEGRARAGEGGGRQGREGRGPGPSRGSAGRSQGQPLHARLPDDGGLADPRGLQASLRRGRRRAPALRRSGRGREDEPGRVRHGQLDRELGLLPDEEPVGHDARPRRQLGRDGLPLAGLKLGFPREYVELTNDPEVKAGISAALKRLEGLGAKVSEVRLKLADAAIPTYYLVATAEASSNLARYDGVHYGHRTKRAESLETLYSRSRSEGFGKEVQRRILLGTFVLSAGHYDAYYMKAQRVRTLIRDDFLEAMKGQDALVGPTSPQAAFKIGEKTSDPLTMYACDIFTVSVNVSGVPAISVPCGFTSTGLPIGLQLIGRPWDDGKLLGIGRSFELTNRAESRWPEVIS